MQYPNIAFRFFTLNIFPNLRLTQKLTGLMLAALIPAFAFAIHGALHEFQIKETSVETDLTRVVALMANSHQHVLDGARQFLTAIAQLPTVQQHEQRRCTTNMNSLLQSFPQYTTFGIAKPNGDIFCSSVPVKLQGNLNNVSFFKEVLRRRAFATGPYEIDAALNKPVVFVGAPVLDAEKNVQLVLFAALDLSYAIPVSNLNRLPKDSSITVFDQDGLILLRHPETENWTGKSIPNFSLLKRLHAGVQEGLSDAAGLDAIERFFYYKKIHQSEKQTVYLAVGMSKAAMFADAKAQLWEQIIGLCVVYFLVLAILWASSHELLVQRMQKLIAATEQMRAGHLHTRTGLAASRDEIGVLARAFDEMAYAMQQRMDNLEQHSNEMMLLKEMNDTLQTCLTRDEIIAVVQQYAKTLFSKQAGILYLMDEESNQFMAKTSWGNPASRSHFSAQDCWALRRSRTYQVQQDRQMPRCQHVLNPPPASYVCIPLIAHGKTFGLYHLENDTAISNDPKAPVSVPLAESASELIALILANMTLQETLKTQAMRDGLTGLLNRRYMEDALIRETRRADRHHGRVSIVMIDIDHFREFNNRYGHAAGDAMLQQFAGLFINKLRGDDLACRYGGEEFTLILPGSTQENARQITEALREKAMSLELHLNGESIANVSLSAGVACYPEHGTSWQAVLHAADLALLEAKKARNCVVVWEPSMDGHVA